MLIKSIKLSKKRILLISILLLLIIFIILGFLIVRKYGSSFFFSSNKKMNNIFKNNNNEVIESPEQNNFEISQQNTVSSENILLELEQNNVNSENTLLELGQNNVNSENIISNDSNDTKKDTSYIKWFEFNVSYDVLQKTSSLDISSHFKNEDVKYNWIELISYLACKYGNDFSKFKQKDLDTIVSRLKNGETIENITKDMKNYSYYYEGYDAVLSQFICEYHTANPNTSAVKIINSTTKNENSTNVENNSSIDTRSNNSTNSESNISIAQKSNTSIIESSFTKVYGVKAFHPLAQGYSYSHYDDFGNSRSYGYKRLHFGNDLMGSIGTPVIAVESGYIEAVRLEPIWWMENWY